MREKRIACYKVKTGEIICLWLSRKHQSLSAYKNYLYRTKRHDFLVKILHRICLVVGCCSFFLFSLFFLSFFSLSFLSLLFSLSHFYIFFYFLSLLFFHSFLFFSYFFLCSSLSYYFLFFSL